MDHSRTIAVIGLGYVGLPVAVAFAETGAPVIGFDIDRTRIAELKNGHDRTDEVDDHRLNPDGLTYTDDVAGLRAADFFIVTVPTPIDGAHRPDLTALRKASETVGKAIRPGAIVVFESTVYPGCTEMVCGPILERESGLGAGQDFFLAYSPERINPGDRKHRFETIVKVVSAQTAETLDIVASVYGSAVQAGIYRASSIQVAEAAKVIENTQRDINIAFMNELAALLDQLGIDTMEVLKAAETKWNFLPFRPGLVGGHCIGVDPYYLTHRADEIGFHPEIILAGRRINDAAAARVAKACVRLMLKRGRRTGRVTVLGLTFKENVPDIRNSGTVGVIRELEEFGFAVQIHDPRALATDAKAEYGVDLVNANALQPSDAVVLAVAHSEFLTDGWSFITGLLQDGAGAVVDVKSALDRDTVPDGVDLWRL
ncbi:MAG: nucleotide sugar dehydrogenase [Pseudomonadota bacterium]